MNFLRCLLVIFVCCSTAAAQGKKLTQAEIDKLTDEGVKNLQGLWLYESGEASGSPYWTLSTESFYIEGNSLHHVRKNGDLIFNGDRVDFSIDPTKSPTTIDLVRKNGNVGQKFFGIFKIEGDKLIIATNMGNDGSPPSKFSTKLTAGTGRATNVQTYKRVVGPELEKAPPKVKMTQKEIDEASDKAVKEMQGHWMTEKVEQNGFAYWSPTCEAMYIERKILRPVKKNGDFYYGLWSVEFQIDPTTGWTGIDLVRDGGRHGKVLGIVKVVGDRLTLASNPHSSDAPRPRHFTTKLTSGIERALMVQTFKRVPPLEVERPKAKPKMSPEEIETAKAVALKELQGHWIFEKSDRNGASFWVLPEDSLHIEKNLMVQAMKNGTTVRNGAALEINIDPRSDWTRIELIRKNGFRGQKILGIYKIEGDRLTLATNTADDNKDIYPAQFTTRLSAGIERAATVQSYRRAKKE